jgi:Cd2+/Zn2+-exporting ATPase
MTELELDGLQCAHCAVKIEKALQSHEKLSKVSLSFATKKLFIESDMDSEPLQKMIQTEVDRIEQGVTVSSPEKNEGPDRNRKTFLKQHGTTISGALIFFITLIFSFDTPWRLPLYIAAYLLVGGDIAYKALKDVLKGKLFDENFLMTLATLGAFALGEYTEAVAVMLFYKVGEGFQNHAVDQSRRSIKSLLNIKAEYANLLKENRTVRVTPQSLEIDDQIIILAGEKVPVDGKILKGSSSLDTSALTGESLPGNVTEGDEILSGSINLTGPLTVKVTSIFQNSAVSRILSLVENATAKKAKTELFITKFARYYTPVIVVTAVLLALVPPLSGWGDYREWISRALIFLVISCPCALVLSIPLGFFAGLGMASRQGILVKGGNYLEALNSIDTFVFDKTGTLTKGNFAITGITGDETLKLAAQLEQNSTHPIARSIVAAYGREIDFENLKDIEELPGKGLTGMYLDKRLLVGNKRLMEHFSIEFSEKSFNGTAVHVAYDQAYRGTIYISDEIKEGSRGLSRKLQTSGTSRVIMLTGDQKDIAREVAEELNIEEFHSELLPEEKLAYVESLINKGKKVLFTGDGINDAPVLARADIGVAMGGLGSDAAIEAADIVIMSDEPSKLLVAKTIARRTRKIVLQNIIFALGIKALFLITGAFGFVTMYEAIFADVGVALIAVLNSMRILRNKAY